MRQSRLFAKVKKQTPKEAGTVSYKFLTRADFIEMLAAGVYNYLPLGWRVHEKLAGIIRKEMNAIGGQEVFLSALQPKELWLKSDRWDKMEPPLFKLKDIHEKEFALGPTHEEVFAKMVAGRITSYRHLPLYLYQIQNKFRNELRPTGGLLRVREFIMKDLYSFHRDEKDLERYFNKVKNSYLKIFKRCGLKILVSEAPGGSIGGTRTYEFQVLAGTGEDKIAYCPKCKWAMNLELRLEKLCPKCKINLIEASTIEVGHIFNLGTKYSEKLDVYFIDKDGKKKPMVMGCYGIGLGRLAAAIVEIHHDKNGIIWPEEVAPFSIHVLKIGEEKKVKEMSEKIYEKLSSKYEVLYDDRDISAGVKFAGADLIGIPIRIVVSAKTLTRKKVEVKRRDEEKVKMIGIGKIEEAITKF